MGANNFVEEVTTTGTVRNAFDSLVSEYEREYGERSYNGTISTCSLGSCKLSFDKYSESNYKKAQKRNLSRELSHNFIFYLAMTIFI